MPRWSTRPFPPYAFVPGVHPHPRRDPKGYAFGRPETRPPSLTPENWRDHDDFRYGVDLHNHGYWWACHETLEGIWHVVGHGSPVGRLLQGIIQVAAGNLKRSMNVEEGAQRLWAEGLARLAASPSPFCGVDVRVFEADARDHAGGRRAAPALITLAAPPRSR
jgi:hypothetical protein